MNKPFFSIVIPTYNSEKSLKYTLESIRSQLIDKKEVEVIVVDGGSTDNTVDIAEHFGATLIENPKRLPEYAKAIGTSRAQGHFIVRMDSDEEFTYDNQLHEKMIFLKDHPEMKILLPNRYATGRKELCGIAAEYMNIFGDPFSYFVYKTKYDKYTTYSKHIVSTDGKHAVMKFDKDDVFPLSDSATSVLSLDYMREMYPTEYDSIDFTCRAFDTIIYDTGICGCIKGDNIKHNCSSSFSTYLSKLRFRVINNIFHKEESGFSAREKETKSLYKRKLLFCLYALVLPIPVIDSVRLAIVYKESTFLLHFVYLYYVCLQIAKYSFIKLLGGDRSNISYGK